MRILSGVQSSGQLHLGNYYGAIQQFVGLQEQGEALYFIANLHALNSVRDPAVARRLTFETAAAFLALGVDPKRAILFRQSDIPELTELYWILGTVVPVSNLERAHSYKDKTAKGQQADFGLFAYPVLMAVDILLYAAEVVPVGKDQVQHLEFARDWATKFNMTYVPGYDPADPRGDLPGHRPGILTLPTPRLRDETAILPGIDGQKMSKTYGNTIDLFGPEAEVKKRIMSIQTDSTPVDKPKATEGSPLYSLLKAVLPARDFADIDASWRAGGKGYGDYKKKLVDAFFGTFQASREAFARLQAQPADVEDILRDGAQRARTLAAPVMQAVRSAVGLAS